MSHYLVHKEHPEGKVFKHEELFQALKDGWYFINECNMPEEVRQAIVDSIPESATKEPDPKAVEESRKAGRPKKWR